MKSTFNLRCALTAGLFLVVAVSLRAQSQGSTQEYMPEVGQQGKDVVWVPTPQELVDKMLEIAKVTPADYVIDLGSGDGRTVITAAKIGARAKGIEYNPDMVALSKKNAIKEGVADRTEFVEADLFETDLSKATVITMFLLPDINLRLRPRLLDLRPGTRIVSNTFTMGEWEPDLEATTDENWNSWNNALLWIIPAKVEGVWESGRDVLTLIQEYQKVNGTLATQGNTLELSEGRLNGEVFTFKVSGREYTAKVNGNTMTGTFTDPAKGVMADWSAKKR